MLSKKKQNGTEGNGGNGDGFKGLVAAKE